jgi:hypothetical protein
VTVVRSYHVFGRAAYEEPLKELELLAAGGDEQARSVALERHGGLIELSLVCEDDVVWVLRREEGEEEGDDDDGE